MPKRIITPDGITATWEVITPDKAKQYLTHNNNNRDLREDRVSALVIDQKSHDFMETGDPIQFYKNGDVANGQHRLQMVVKSGIPQRFLVVRGLEQKAGLVLDSGIGRTAVDAWKIAGNEGPMSNKLISVCRAVEEGTYATRTITRQQKYDMVEKHLEAALWCIHNGPHAKFVDTSITIAAMVRAWYIEKDHDRLAEFGKVMTSGISSGIEDSGAISLRNYLIANRDQRIGNALWPAHFMKIQNAIWYFMHRKTLTVIKGLADERYPLKKKQG